MTNWLSNGNRIHSQQKSECNAVSILQLWPPVSEICMWPCKNIFQLFNKVRAACVTSFKKPIPPPGWGYDVLLQTRMLHLARNDGDLSSLFSFPNSIWERNLSWNSISVFALVRPVYSGAWPGLRGGPSRVQHYISRTSEYGWWVSVPITEEWSTTSPAIALRNTMS